MLNVCLICSLLLIVKVIFVITVFFSFLCVSTILVNKDDQKNGENGPNCLVDHISLSHVVVT